MARRTLFPLRGRRVFVAGHRGMVGSALIRRLAQEEGRILTVGRDAVDRRYQAAVDRWLHRQIRANKCAERASCGIPIGPRAGSDEGCRRAAAINSLVNSVRSGRNFRSFWGSRPVLRRAVGRDPRGGSGVGQKTGIPLPEIDALAELGKEHKWLTRSSLDPRPGPSMEAGAATLPLTNAGHDR